MQLYLVLHTVLAFLFAVMEEALQVKGIKGAFTARLNSLFILFKFQYLTKYGTLVLVYGILEL